MSSNIVQHDILEHALKSCQTLDLGDYENSSIRRVRFLVQHMPRKRIFCEMMELVNFRANAGYREDTYEWKEVARWIKYEETVEETGRRWSKPHSSIVTVPYLMQTRNCFRNGTSLLNIDASNFSEICEELVKSWLSPDGNCSEDAATLHLVKRVLLSSKKHLHRQRFRDPLATRGSITHRSGEDSPQSPTDGNSNSFTFDVRQGGIERKISSADDSTFTRDSSRRLNTTLYKKVHPEAESSTVLIGRVKNLRSPLSAFVRLKEAVVFLDMPEIPVPTRFMFILLVPMEHTETELYSIGQCVGTLFADHIFAQIAYQAVNSLDLSYGVDEFISQAVMIPPGKWDVNKRLEPSEKDEPQTDERSVGPVRRKSIKVPMTGAGLEHSNHAEGLHRTGRPFGGMTEDIKRKWKFYRSDITDYFKRDWFVQCFGATFFLYLANLTIIVCFSGIMYEELHHALGIREGLIAGFIYGVVYSLFSGQPLTILGPTGHTLVFEMIMWKFCYKFGVAYFEFRCWTGIWTGLIMIAMVAVDLSVLVSMITKFAEEVFSVLISLMFIVEAFGHISTLYGQFPVTHPDDLREILHQPCRCLLSGPSVCAYLNDNSSFLLEVNRDIRNELILEHNDCSGIINASFYLDKDVCEMNKGIAHGLQCDYHPDVFFFSLILFAGTFILCIAFNAFGSSTYFRNSIRSFISQFNVVLSVAIMTIVSFISSMEVAQLHIYAGFRPTDVHRKSWFINPFVANYWYTPPLAFFSGVLFFILVIMDQQVAALIINRKENSLKKGFGYHLDIFVLSILTIVSGLFGIPFYVGNIVTCVMHEEALKIYQERAAPGEQPKMYGVREQRLTAFFAHVLIGCSLFMSPILKIIPTPVLFGLLLYLGVASLAGMELVERFELFFMPIKYQPDYHFLKVVPLSKVYMFTVIQLIALAILFVIKHVKEIAFIFPITIVILVMVRRWLEYLFSHQELLALDDPLPRIGDLLKTELDDPKEKHHHHHHAHHTHNHHIPGPDSDDSSSLINSSEDADMNDGIELKAIQMRKSNTGRARGDTEYHSIVETRSSLSSIEEDTRDSGSSDDVITVVAEDVFADSRDA